MSDVAFCCYVCGLKTWKPWFFKAWNSLIRGFYSQGLHGILEGLDFGWRLPEGGLDGERLPFFGLLKPHGFGPFFGFQSILPIQKPIYRTQTGLRLGSNHRCVLCCNLLEVFRLKFWKLGFLSLPPQTLATPKSG